MVAFSDLNDDGLRPVLEYLPSRELFACISSPQLKSQLLHRCALDVLTSEYAPFSLRPTFTSSTQFSMWLEDSKRVPIAQLKRPSKFSASPLASFVEKAEIPVFYNYVSVATPWLNLVKGLPSIRSLSVRFLQQPGGLYSSERSFRWLATELSQLFPNLHSFAVVGPAILPGHAKWTVIEMISSMPGVRSLKIPTYLLSLFLANLPVKASELSELILYQNHNELLSMISCAEVISVVSGAGFVELTHLKYSCRHHDTGLPTFKHSTYYRHDCFLTLAPLQGLAKLSALTLDVDFGPSYLASPVEPRVDQLVSFSTLNVMLRRNDFGVLQNDWTHSLFSQFSRVDALRIFALQLDASLLERIPTVAFADNRRMTSALRELNVELNVRSTQTARVCVPGLPVTALSPFSVLPDNLQDFHRLENLEITAANLTLNGVLSELINRLKRCPALKTAKISAGVESTQALEASLQDGCKIVRLIEKPRELANDCFVLRPERYWRPLEIRLSVENDAVYAANESQHFALRIIVTQ